MGKKINMQNHLGKQSLFATIYIYGKQKKVFSTPSVTTISNKLLSCVNRDIQNNLSRQSRYTW